MCSCQRQVQHSDHAAGISNALLPAVCDQHMGDDTGYRSGVKHAAGAGLRSSCLMLQVARQLGVPFAYFMEVFRRGLVAKLPHYYMQQPKKADGKRYVYFRGFMRDSHLVAYCIQLLCSPAEAASLCRSGATVTWHALAYNPDIRHENVSKPRIDVATELVVQRYTIP